MLVHGNRGCGKSALVKLLAGTWPVVMGEISRPKLGIHAVLSKPYLMLEAGLKEQIIYPESPENVNIEALNSAIQVARISHLFERKDSQASTLLSDAEQEKLMIARLIYHKPKFALLDDCFRHIETDHLRQILMYLRNELGAGILVACSTTLAETIRDNCGFKFDLELILPSGKQPPRHELIMNSRPA